jgi:hypothetical protein
MLEVKVPVIFFRHVGFSATQGWTLNHLILGSFNAPGIYLSMQVTKDLSNLISRAQRAFKLLGARGILAIPCFSVVCMGVVGGVDWLRLEIRSEVLFFWFICVLLHSIIL